MSTMLIEVKGWSGGLVYYAPDEKHLYCWKDGYNCTKYLVCYETVASRSKKNKKSVKCPARRHLDEKSGKSSCTLSQHSSHDNHEVIYRDLVVRMHCAACAENVTHAANGKTNMNKRTDLS